MEWSSEGIDSMFGHELNRFNDGTNHSVQVNLVIYNSIDLILHEPLIITINAKSAAYYPNYAESFLGKDVKVYVKEKSQIHYFGNSIVDEKEIKIDYLENCKHFGMLSIWFHAVRNHLKKTDKDIPFTSSLLLTSEFMFHCYDEILFTANQINPLHLIHGISRLQGRRNYMEDTDFIYDPIQITSSPGINTMAMYGILDGHGGKDCADYCVSEIPIKIIAALRKHSHCFMALYNAFLEADQGFLQEAVHNNSGSTANVMIFDRKCNAMYIANTGDTRTVLCRNGRAWNLSIDRKATDPEEMVRIYQAGGYISMNRVLGSLAIARALGDRLLKRDPMKRILIPDPEMSSFQPGPMDQFLVMATDGLWDVMSSQSVVDYILHHLNKEEWFLSPTNTMGNVQRISQVLTRISNELTNYAVDTMGSQDNVTVMIIYLQGADQLPSYSTKERDRRPSYLNKSKKIENNRLSHEESKGKETKDPLDFDDNEIRPIKLPNEFKRSASIARTTIFSKKLEVNESKGMDAGGKYGDEIKEDEDPDGLHSIVINESPFKRTNLVVSSSIHRMKKKDVEEEDDDFMSFLKDDSNF